jgi:predicted ArsR family transcriptional regulator
VLAFVPIVSPLVIAERRIVRALRSAGATSASAATNLELHRRIHRRSLDRLRERGAVKTGPSGRVWLDESAYSAARNHRRRVAGAALGTAAAAAGLLAVLFNR